MEPSRLPFNGRALVSPQGRVCVWPFHDGLLVVKLVGHGLESFAEPIVSEFQRMAASGQPLKLYFDAEGLETYDSPLRTRVTSCCVSGRASIASLHVIVRSRLVAMGVSVANLALGSVMTVHTRRATFVSALDDALVRSGVAGFSSQGVAAA